MQRVARSGSRVESWTVLGDDDVPVVAIERYLSYLSDIERSPNTVKAYAHDLKDFFVFLAHRGVDWDVVRLEDIGEFVAWLRLPKAARFDTGTAGDHCLGIDMLTEFGPRRGITQLFPAPPPPLN